LPVFACGPDTRVSTPLYPGGIEEEIFGSFLESPHVYKSPHNPVMKKQLPTKPFYPLVTALVAALAILPAATADAANRSLVIEADSLQVFPSSVAVWSINNEGITVGSDYNNSNNIAWYRTNVVDAPFQTLARIADPDLDLGYHDAWKISNGTTPVVVGNSGMTPVYWDLSGGGDSGPVPVILPVSLGTGEARAINANGRIIGGTGFYPYPNLELGYWDISNISNPVWITLNDSLRNTAVANDNPVSVNLIYGINNSNDIVGYGTNSEGHHIACYWRAVTLAGDEFEFVNPGAESGFVNTFAQAINNNGMIAGTGFNDGLSTYTGLIWIRNEDDGSWETINVNELAREANLLVEGGGNAAGFTSIMTVTDINDTNGIVGRGMYSDGEGHEEQRYFYLQLGVGVAAVPEPATWGTLAGAVVLLVRAVVTRRRRCIGQGTPGHGSES
jgi:hypothetical protein